jgi:hypothetical protein
MSPASSAKKWSCHDATLPQWWSVWTESGKWAVRGRGDGYVMARNLDAGAYAQGNVYICSQVQNMRDSYAFRPAAERAHYHDLTQASTGVV